MRLSSVSIIALLAGVTTSVFVSPAAWAQVVSIPASKQPVRIKTVSKTASKTQYATIPKKATYTESTIGRQQIETSSPAVSAQTLLNQLPSVVATQSGPNGMRTNIQFRAFNDGQFSETYDGIAINDLFNAGVAGAASARNNTLVTLDDISGVQAFRGVNNPAVNSYNSLGGTINFVPRDAQRAANSQAGISYGSFNTLNYHFRLNTGDVHGIRQLLSFRRSVGDSWIDYGKDQNNHIYYTMNMPIFGGSGKAFAYFLYNQNRGNTPHSVPLALVEQFGPHYQWSPGQTYSVNTDTNYLAIVGASENFTPILSGNVKFFFGEDNYMRTSYSNPNMLQGPDMPYQLPNSPATYDFSPYPGITTYDPLAMFGSYAMGSQYHFYGYNQDEIGLQPSATLDLPYNQITVGGNVTSGHMHSREYWYGTLPVPQIPGFNNAWNEHDLRTYASIYIQDKISLFGGRLHITPGVKYLNAITKDTDEAGFFYSITGSVSNVTHYASPTVGTSLALTHNLTAYCAYGQNIEFPTIDAYYNDVGQPLANGQPGTPAVTVQPEYVKDYETGIRYEHHGLSLQLDYYRENFLNFFITTTNPVSGASETNNGGTALFDGEELQAIYQAGHVAKVPGSWSAFFNYAHNNARFQSSINSTQFGTVTKGQPLANVPDNLISGGIDWTHRNWLVGGNAQYVGTEYLQQGFAGTPTSLQSPPYFLMNFVFQKTIPVHLGRIHAIRVALNIDNLLNRRYYTNDFVYQTYAGANYQSVLLGAPRAFYLSLNAFF